MKRKRSVGAVSSRSTDKDGELKRNMNNKLYVESSLLPGDSAHGFRLGASGGGSKLEPLPSPTGSTARITFKSEREKLMLSRDVSVGPIKERPLGQVNVKYVSPLLYFALWVAKLDFYDKDKKKWTMLRKDFFMQAPVKLTTCDYHKGLDMVVVGVVFSNGVFTLYEMPDLVCLHLLSFSREKITTAVFNGLGNCSWLAYAHDANIRYFDPRGRGSSSGGGNVMTHVGVIRGGDGVKKMKVVEDDQLEKERELGF